MDSQGDAAVSETAALPVAVAGTRLGRYQLEQRLGVGGMAEVYRARAVGAAGFELPVAIKWVKPGVADRPELNELFVHEGRVSTRLRHPNIVAVSDFDRDEHGRHYLVMELVEGRDLAALAATGPLPIAAVIHIGVELARGLGFAHDLRDAGDGVRGVIHRDVSPQNTLLSWDGAVKLSDFGIAKLRAATMASGTVHITGKPAYMSPQQARGEPIDGRSDLFAVGVLLWEAVTGRRLFSGGDTREVIARLLYQPVDDPRRWRSDVPADLAAVIMRLLSRDPDQRPLDAAALIDELVACAAAPRDGESALAQVLAERFAGQAPPRAAARRARTPVGVPMATPVPSLSQARAIQAAETVTRAGKLRVPARDGEVDRRQRRLIMVAALVAVAGAAVALALLLLR